MVMAVEVALATATMALDIPRVTTATEPLEAFMDTALAAGITAIIEAMGIGPTVDAFITVAFITHTGAIKASTV